jgi:ATP-dependent RNA helicase MRH4
MANTFHHGDNMTATKGEFEVHPGASGMGHSVDVLVGTPSRMLEMARGTGWNKVLAESDGARRKKPEVSLSDVEWVIVDEADVLFGTFALMISLPHYFFAETYEIGSDFIDHTLLLLSDVATARGKPVPVPVISQTNESTRTQAPTLLDYPFNFVLTSATIPVALAAHLDMHHPTMTRLVSPRLHRLPAHLTLEFAPYPMLPGIATRKFSRNSRQSGVTML